MHGQTRAPQSLPIIHAHSPKMTYFHCNKDVCMYYLQTLRGCSSAVHEPYAMKLLQKFYIPMDHPEQSLNFHYVHVHAHNTFTSLLYRCVHILCMHMHEVTGSFGRIEIFIYTFKVTCVPNFSSLE